MDKQTRLLALDWGTTSLRAYRLGDQAQPLECRELPWGIMKLPTGNGGREEAFRQAFFAACEGWLSTTTRHEIIACGMIGSAQGWKEAAYLHCPTSLTELAGQLCQVAISPTVRLSIIPGLAIYGSDPEVMRGEETQIFGILSEDPNATGEHIIGMPGTHSKWALTQRDSVSEFHTFMTGEVYEALRSHTILGVTMQPAQETDWQAFDDGVATAMRQADTGLLSTLFSTRTRLLAGQLSAQQQPDYLSGLLIGHEFIGLRRTLLAKRQTPITLTGNPLLCARYQRAFQQVGGTQPISYSAQATVTGLWQIALRAGLL
ncbi:2-dehydro-3-deoxygalactonokinase [Pseudocitrobacter cyperus]|uniref:2-dehydro-3-deoxygalactonokinase n=1 Tax=Pseudocitrobacter cyperus TaxID=3112843 RepID=A0ABV0HQH9_9ENTR